MNQEEYAALMDSIQDAVGAWQATKHRFIELGWSENNAEAATITLMQLAIGNQ